MNSYIVAKTDTGMVVAIDDGPGVWKHVEDKGWEVLTVGGNHKTPVHAIEWAREVCE